MACSTLLKFFVLVWFILGKPCLHPTAEQEEEQTSCVGKTLQPEKPCVSNLYRQLANNINYDIWQLSAGGCLLYP